MHRWMRSNGSQCLTSSISEKNYKYRVKKGLNIQGNDTRESIIDASPNIMELDVEDLEITIDTWSTPKDKVIISTNVTNY
jgi:hypothetical protein